MPCDKIQPNKLEASYTDVMMPSSKHYGHPGKFVSCNGDASLEPERRQLAAVLAFAAFFIPVFSLTAYFFIPSPEKWLFVIAGPTVGSLTFGIIYFLIKQEVDGGPYIKFESKTDEIILPRINKTFRRSDVTLQWITGRSANDPDVHTDLNLIVVENKIKNRYFVMSGPYKKYVKQFVETSSVKLVKVRGWLG